MKDRNRYWKTKPKIKQKPCKKCKTWHAVYSKLFEMNSIVCASVIKSLENKLKNALAGRTKFPKGGEFIKSKHDHEPVLPNELNGLNDDFLKTINVGRDETLSGNIVNIAGDKITSNNEQFLKDALGIKNE